DHPVHVRTHDAQPDDGWRSRQPRGRRARQVRGAGLRAAQPRSDRGNHLMTEQLKLAAPRRRSVFASVEDAIAAIREGQIVIVVDDDDRENEGDLTMAAEKVTPEAVNFMAKHG